jgi:type IV pilus assembly protein PilE
MNRETKQQSGQRRTRRGFSIIELMIVVVIIGVLAAIAFPSYQASVRKSNRGAAKALLMDAAMRQTQFLLDRRSYASDTTELGLSVPEDVSSNYAVSIAATAGPPPAFTVTAAPKAGTIQEGDGILTIDSTGQKLPANKW